jgi:NAD(P)H-dependent FMN reductase
MEKTKIQIILGSTRDGRFGINIANWIVEEAKKRQDFDVEFIDLKEWNLPFFNDPINPSAGNYSFDTTKKWSEKISEADGYIIVTPEYNRGYPAALKNALDLLYNEWNRKTVGFISYGGVAGGLRAIEQLRQVVTELQMADIREAINFTFAKSHFDENGQIKDPEAFSKKANSFFDQLIWWTNALKTARENN